MDQVYLNKVNTFLKKAFGKRARGNLKYSIFQNGHTDPFYEIDELDMISRTKYFIFEQPIGRFNRSDGSSLKVFPKFRRSVEIFADLYESEFGKRPKIEISERICYGW